MRQAPPRRRSALRDPTATNSSSARLVQTGAGPHIRNGREVHGFFVRLEPPCNVRAGQLKKTPELILISLQGGGKVQLIFEFLEKFFSEKKDGLLYRLFAFVRLEPAQETGSPGLRDAGSTVIGALFEESFPVNQANNGCHRGGEHIRHHNAMQSGQWQMSAGGGLYPRWRAGFY